MNAALRRQPSRGPAVRRPGALAAGLALALVLGTATARAGQGGPGLCTLEDVRTAQPVTAAPGDNQPAAAAMAAELAHPLPTITVEHLAQRAVPRAGWAQLHFVDHLELGERIRSLRRVRLLRLWDDTRLTIFLGLNRAGVAGLHVQQQDPGEPLQFARVPSSAPLPPLRAVPLDSR